MGRIACFVERGHAEGVMALAQQIQLGKHEAECRQHSEGWVIRYTVPGIDRAPHVPDLPGAWHLSVFLDWALI